MAVCLWKHWVFCCHISNVIDRIFAIMHATRTLPRPLKSGDAIQLVAPARFAVPEVVDVAVEAISRAGFEAIVPEGLVARDGQFGGPDEHRAAELNRAFGDPAIRAVWAVRGGYGCARLLPQLDAVAFQQDPTWIVGFSDVTALHSWADAQGVATMHAPVASTYGKTEAAGQMWSALKSASHSVSGIPVVGGNLSVLYSLLGTPYFPDVRGCWLLLEDLDEYLYHIDRMLCAFRLAGTFALAHGIVMGSFLNLHDNTLAFGQSLDNPFCRTLSQMVAEHVPSDKPVLWDVPVGHGTQNQPVVLGADMILAGSPEPTS